MELQCRYGSRRIPAPWKTAAEPLYVCGIDTVSNQVILGDGSDTYGNELVCDNLNYMGGERFSEGMVVSAKIRYGAKEELCRISHVTENSVKCEFVNTVRVITPGQAIVFYDNDIVLGGGIIC